MTEYNANSIKALDQHQHLLKRLSLIFGAVEGPGAEFSSQKGVALREILDNGLDEIRAGHGEWLRLSFYKDRSFEVFDSGRGIPTDIGQDAEGRPANGIYLSLGLLQSGGKFETDSTRFTSGLNGLGGSASIHVSRMAVIKVYRSNKVHELHFQDGTPGFFADPEDPDSKFTPAKDFKELKVYADKRPTAEKKKYKHGTSARLWLRDEVFSSDSPYDDQDIIQRLRGTAFLVPTLHAEVYNELNEIDGKPQTEYYNFPDGVEDLITLNQHDEKLHETIHITTTGKYLEKNVAVLQKDGAVKNQNLERSVPIEVAFRYGSGYGIEGVSTFVNTIHTKLNGVHRKAFENALIATFGEKFESMRGLLKKGEVDQIMAEDFMEGLTAIVSVQVAEPTFTSQSKEALSGREVQKAIQEALTVELNKWISVSKNKATLEMIAKKVSQAAKNRQAAKEKKEMNRKKNEISSSKMPAKLADCDLSGTDAAELYICEGDSAHSSLKAARDGDIHALLPIRGKIINALIATPKALMDNTEVQDIIKAMGAGSGADFDIDKMRYGRVFVAADADPDGLAIACLVYALYWVLFRDVIMQGRFYKVEPPLFVISTSQGAKSTKHYALDDKERDKIVAKLNKQNIKHSITRCKGLGEMNEDDLAETALNPDTRIVTQVTVDDIDSAFTSLTLILGKDADLRKEWLESAEVTNDMLDD